MNDGELTDFGDYGKVRDGIFDSALAAVGESNVANDRYGLKITNARYAGPELYSQMAFCSAKA